MKKRFTEAQIAFALRQAASVKAIFKYLFPSLFPDLRLIVRSRRLQIRTRVSSRCSTAWITTGKRARCRAH